MKHKSPIGKIAGGAFFVSMIFFNHGSHSLPLQTHDQNPFVLANGLIPAVDADIVGMDPITFDAGLMMTNTLNDQQVGQESLLVDYETLQLDLDFSYRFDEWVFRASMPLIDRNGGAFDQAIDDWHQLFGLPRGTRPSTAKNQYRLRYIKNSVTQFDINRPASGIGDIQFLLGRQIVSSDHTNLSIWGVLDFPTGDAADLLGSEKTDLSVTLALEKKLDLMTTLFANVGILHPGSDMTYTLSNKEQVYFYYLGIDRSITPSLKLQIQLEFHSGFYENTDLPFFGDVIALGFGGTWRVDRCSDLQVAFNEDIDVGASPDVSLSVRWIKKIGRCSSDSSRF